MPKTMVDAWFCANQAKGLTVTYLCMTLCLCREYLGLVMLQTRPC
jgi:hypothetical protein